MQTRTAALVLEFAITTASIENRSSITVLAQERRDGSIAAVLLRMPEIVPPEIFRVPKLRRIISFIAAIKEHVACEFSRKLQETRHVYSPPFAKPCRISRQLLSKSNSLIRAAEPHHPADLVML